MFCNNCGDKIEKGEKFCNKCGKPLNYGNIESEKLGFKKILLFIGIGLGIGVALLFFILLIIGNNTDKYYFNTIGDEQNDDIIVSSDTPPKKGKYSTVILADNVYSGVKIDSKDAAYSLIEKDSISQKDKCPKSIRDIEDNIIKKYNITAVNLCEMDVSFAKELGNVFQKVYDEFPVARGYITNLTLINAPLQEEYIAAFMPMFNFATSKTSSTYPWVIKTQVLLNTSYFLNKERLSSAVLQSSQVGHFPKNSTIYSPVAHELGHYLSFLAMMRHYKINSVLLVEDNSIDAFYDLYSDFTKGDYSLSMIKEAYTKYLNDTGNNISLDEWRGTISKYALAKDNSGNYIYDETIAEAFHDVYLNNDNASVASKYIVSILKDKLES